MSKERLNDARPLSNNDSNVASPNNTYPNIPPPTYTESIPIQGPQPSASIPASNLMTPNTGVCNAFSSIPAVRYDTMTSYVEDGGSVHAIITMSTILDQPILIRCPFCHATVTTKTKPIAGTSTWLCCLGIALIGCPWGCCLIPFCIRRFRDIQHHCPRCKNLIALYKRL